MIGWRLFLAVEYSRDVVAGDLGKEFYVQMGCGAGKSSPITDAVGAGLSGLGFRLDDKRVSLGDFVSASELEAFSTRDVYYTGRTVLSCMFFAGKCVLIGDACTAFCTGRSVC